MRPSGIVLSITESIEGLFSGTRMGCHSFALRALRPGKSWLMCWQTAAAAGASCRDALASSGTSAVPRSSRAGRLVATWLIPAFGTSRAGLCQGLPGSLGAKGDIVLAGDIPSDSLMCYPQVVEVIPDAPERNTLLTPIGVDRSAAVPKSGLPNASIEEVASGRCGTRHPALGR